MQCPLNLVSISTFFFSSSSSSPFPSPSPSLLFSLSSSLLFSSLSLSRELRKKSHFLDTRTSRQKASGSEIELLKMSKPLLEESDVGEQKRHHEKASEGDRKQFVSEYVGKLLIVFAQRDIIFPF